MQITLGDIRMKCRNRAFPVKWKSQLITLCEVCRMVHYSLLQPDDHLADYIRDHLPLPMNGDMGRDGVIIFGDLHLVALRNFPGFPLGHLGYKLQLVLSLDNQFLNLPTLNPLLDVFPILFFLAHLHKSSMWLRIYYISPQWAHVNADLTSHQTWTLNTPNSQ